MATAERVGVVGAGEIGASVAHAVARAGIAVVLHDVDADALDGAVGRIASNERLARLRLGAATLADIAYTSDLGELAGCAVVVENVVEDLAEKERVHHAIDAVVDGDCVVAVNTSAVPITRLALCTGHPERVVGAHFMNPVAMIDTVEVVRTEFTDPAALDRLRALLERIGKTGVVVADAAGFVVNRCLMPFVNEAADLLDDGVATPADVDRLFTGCLGHKSGPLRTADLIGVDTVVRTLDVLAHYYGPRFTPAPRLRRMVDAGRLGRKSGRGFYDYPGERSTP